MVEPFTNWDQMMEAVNDLIYHKWDDKKAKAIFARFKATNTNLGSGAIGK